MRILIAVSPKTDNECADPVSLIASFPWPSATIFQVITVAEVVPNAIVEVVPGTYDSPEIQHRVASLAADNAKSSTARLRDHGLKAESFSAEGNPKDLITDHATQWNADLIVVEACDRSLIEQFFLGSVSQSVVKHAPCSVLVIRPGAREEYAEIQGGARKRSYFDIKSCGVASFFRKPLDISYVYDPLDLTARSFHAQGQLLLINFLKIDLELGFTFVAMAKSHANSDPAKSRGEIGKAVEVVNTIRKFEGRIQAPQSWREVHERGNQLESALSSFAQLGGPAPPKISN